MESTEEEAMVVASDGLAVVVGVDVELAESVIGCDVVASSVSVLLSPAYAIRSNAANASATSASLVSIGVTITRVTRRFTLIPWRSSSGASSLGCVDVRMRWCRVDVNVDVDVMVLVAGDVKNDSVGCVGVASCVTAAADAGLDVDAADVCCITPDVCHTSQNMVM